MHLIRCISAAILCCCAFSSQSQNKNSVWVFGDSALIDFSDTANILTGQSSVNSRGSCASISDTAGNLLFYTGYDDDVYSIGGPPFNGGEVWNNLHQTMQNGDSLVMGLWYHETFITPDPGNLNQYYVFSIGVTGNYGLYYSIIDISANGGLGAIIQKNIQLQSFEMVDCLTAVKHGNGRDWWIFFRRYDPINLSPNDEFHSYLITPLGIINYTMQNIGSMITTGFGKITFNKEGNKIAYNNYRGLLELYDFDRCTGIISNPNTVFIENTTSPWPARWSNEFSASGDILYVSTHPDTTYLFQYDLTSANIAASEDTLWITVFPLYCGGALKRAPDDKIYFSSNYYNGFTFPYPYADTMYNQFNMNLSVINSPDSLGTACDFQPYGFYLGGKRTYLGLPNNPDYELGAWVGSPCDTLGVGIDEVEIKNNAELLVYYHPLWQTAFINAQKLKGRNYSLHVYDILGKEVFKEEGKLNTEYFTKDLSCAAYSRGIYIVHLETEKEKLIKKFIKQ